MTIMTGWVLRTDALTPLSLPAFPTLRRGGSLTAHGDRQRRSHNVMMITVDMSKAPFVYFHTETQYTIRLPISAVYAVWS